MRLFAAKAKPIAEVKHDTCSSEADPLRAVDDRIARKTTSRAARQRAAANAAAQTRAHFQTSPPAGVKRHVVA